MFTDVQTALLKVSRNKHVLSNQAIAAEGFSVKMQ